MSHKKSEKKWRATVTMKKAHGSVWDHKPSTDDVLEELADAIVPKRVPNDAFLIVVQEVPSSSTPNQT